MNIDEDAQFNLGCAAMILAVGISIALIIWALNQ